MGALRLEPVTHARSDDGSGTTRWRVAGRSGRSSSQTAVVGASPWQCRCRPMLRRKPRSGGSNRQGPGQLARWLGSRRVGQAMSGRIRNPADLNADVGTPSPDFDLLTKLKTAATPQDAALMGPARASVLTCPTRATT